MAEDKKGFILYADQIDLFKQLTDEKAGQLIKHIFEYVNDKNPETNDLIINLAFTPIKQQLKRDLLKYTGAKEKKSLSGREGNLKRWNLDIYNQYKKGDINLKQAESIADSRKVSHSDKVRSHFIANIAVNDNVNDNVNDITIINKNKNNFDEYYKVYISYCSAIMQDDGLLESLARKYKMTADKKVYIPTVKKYLTMFLAEFLISKKIHDNRSSFNTHFNNWLNKQPVLKNVTSMMPNPYESEL